MSGRMTEIPFSYTCDKASFFFFFFILRKRRFKFTSTRTKKNRRSKKPPPTYCESSLSFILHDPRCADIKFFNCDEWREGIYYYSSLQIFSSGEIMYNINRLTNLVPVIDSSRVSAVKKRKKNTLKCRKKEEEAYLWIYDQFKFPSNGRKGELRNKKSRKKYDVGNRFDEIQRKSR